MIDTALELRKKIDAGFSLSKEEIAKYLDESSLVKELTAEEVKKPLAMVWRLIALSEIPYAETLGYTQKLIMRISEKLGCEMGFSLSGDRKQFLPCYNSMLVSAFCRLHQHENSFVIKGIEWLIVHQPFARNSPKRAVDSISFERYGGCFKKTPCYIGIVKATHALVSYSALSPDTAVETKAKEGIEYILSHNLFKRKSCNKPITKHILNFSFPESYHTNIVDLLRLMALAGVQNDRRIDEAIAYIQDKKVKENLWRHSFRYKADGYQVFDKGRRPAEWLSYIIADSLEKITT